MKNELTKRLVELERRIAALERETRKTDANVTQAAQTRKANAIQ